MFFRMKMCVISHAMLVIPLLVLTQESVRVMETGMVLM